MHSAHGTRPGFAVELIPIDLETSTSQPFVRRAAGVLNPGAERRAGRPSSRQVQDSIGAQAASKAALGPGPEPRAAAPGREHGEDPPFDAAEHYGIRYRINDRFPVWLPRSRKRGRKCQIRPS